MILCSVAGYSLEVRMYNSFLEFNVEMSSLCGRKWVVGVFSNKQQKVPISAAFQHKKLSWYHCNSLVRWWKENFFKVRCYSIMFLRQFLMFKNSITNITALSQWSFHWMHLNIKHWHPLNTYLNQNIQWCTCF